MSNKFRIFFSLVFLLGVLLIAGPAGAQSEDALTVTDVVIDKTDKNAVAARTQAIAEAQVSAFQKLAERSMTAELYKNYSVPDEKTIASFVKDFEIKNEQISATRYVANFTVRFSTAAADYLNSIGGNVSDDAPVMQSAPAKLPQLQTAAAAKTEPVSILVLPYFRDISGKSVLWEDPNPWREVWQGAGNSAPAPGVTITVPVGDIDDISLGSSEAVWAGDHNVIERLRENYKANDVVMAVASKSDLAVQVDLYTYRNGKISRKNSLPAITVVGDDYKPAFQQALDQIVAATRTVEPFMPVAGADAQEPEISVTPIDQLQAPGVAVKMETVKVDAMMNFLRFPEWMDMQRRLTAISPELKVDINSMTKDAAWFTITVKALGGLDGFQKTLAEHGMELIPLDATGVPTGRTLYMLKVK